MKSSVVVVTPAASLNLLTLADLKALLGITSAAEDARLTLLLAQASNICANYCSRVFAKEGVTETFRLSRNDRFGGRMRFDGIQQEAESLILNRYPVDSAVAIVLTEDDTLLATTDYAVNYDNGMITRLFDGVPMNWAADKVVVSYTGGYTLPAAAPGDLAHACTIITSQMRSGLSRDPLAKRIEIPDVQTVDFWVGGVTSTGLPVEATSILDKYSGVNL